MRQVIQMIRHHLPDWNKKAYTESELIDIVQDRAVYLETDLIGRPGAYLIYKDVNFVLIRPDVDTQYRPWVIAHELAHLLTHIPGAFASTKHEKEADFIASVALIPRAHLDRPDLLEHPPELVKFRYAVYKEYGL